MGRVHLAAGRPGCSQHEIQDQGLDLPWTPAEEQLQCKGRFGWGECGGREGGRHSKGVRPN